MSSLPSDWNVALQQIAGELAAMRAQMVSQAELLRQLGERNDLLQKRLEHSEQARVDLLAETERILELLAEARLELRARAPG